MGCVDEFWVDIKDMDPDIYRLYTGADNARVRTNLRMLLSSVGPERVIVRVPNIPGFNAPDDVERSLDALRDMGVKRVNVFTYVDRRNSATG